MDESLKAGDGTVNPTVQGVKVEGQQAPVEPKSPEQLLKEKNDRIAALEDQVKNLNRGIKQAKGKQVDNDNDEGSEITDPREIARQAALEVLAESDLASAIRDRDALVTQTLTENNELRLALKNRPGTGTGTGSNQSVETPKDNVLSVDQERELRARGWDDARIEHFKNLARK